MLIKGLKIAYLGIGRAAVRDMLMKVGLLCVASDWSIKCVFLDPGAKRLAFDSTAPALHRIARCD